MRHAKPPEREPRTKKYRMMESNENMEGAMTEIYTYIKVGSSSFNGEYSSIKLAYVDLKQHGNIF